MILLDCLCALRSGACADAVRATADARVAERPDHGGGSPSRDTVRVAAVLTPTADSHIEMEVWMPLTKWNGKFQAVGNGGWAGSISFPAMAAALQEGYATASTDTGHKSSETPGGSFALGHPEKLVDYGYRAVHEMTVEGEGDHRGILRARPAVVVLEQLLEWRPRRR